MLTLRDISEVCSMIQRLNSYNLLADKVTEKVQFTEQTNKPKKYWRLGNELSINDNT